MAKNNFPPGAWLALTGKRMLLAFKDGHKPTRDISLSQMRALSREWGNAADERQAFTEERNRRENGGVQHTSVTFDRAQLAWLVASVEGFQEPVSCKGLTSKLERLRDSLVGSVEEDEAAPLLKDGAMVIFRDDEGRFHFPDG